MPQALCLTPREIDGLATGGLRGAARTRAEAHARQCADCRRSIELARSSPLASDAPTVARDARTTRGREPARDAAASLPIDDTLPLARGADGTRAEPIPGYTILEEIHRGGQGVVFRAVQRATKRTVALKVLREGRLATDAQRFRFEREVELAAGLRHPHVATIHDSGEADGRQYYAMEYIDGLPLDRWWREKRPARRDALALFAAICDAVAYAHRRGVIHRDLKPANILVDGEGQPHVVDFGLAKASGPESADERLTVAGEFVGTLAYASPEQARGNPALVDTRTDVYALGVILFEMLTGQHPYPLGAHLAETLRHVMETEARHPSTVARDIDDELATIMLAALEKDPERRYPSVEGLGRDVQSYLAGRPIDAKGASTWYVLSKTVRRYRVAIVVVTAFAALLLVSAVVAGLQARRASRAEASAIEEALHARRDARSAREQAELAERRTYDASLAAASASLQSGQAREARRRLGLCAERLRGWEWRHLWLAADASGLELQLGEPVTGLRVAPDGSITAWSLGLWAAWDADGSALSAPTPAPGEDVTDASPSAPDLLAVSPRRDLFAVRSSQPDWERLGRPGRIVRLVEASGWVHGVLEGHAWRPDAAAFSPDGQRVVTATSDPVDPDPRLWSVMTGVLLRRLSREAGARGQLRNSGDPSALAFSPDGTNLAAAGLDGMLRTWTCEDGALRWSAPLNGTARTAAYSGDGARLAVASGSGASVFAGADGSPGPTLPHGQAVLTVALDARGARAATGGADGAIKLWDAPQALLLADLRGHDSGVTALAFTADGSSLVSGSLDGTVRTWSADPGSAASTLLALPRARCVAWAPDGRVAAGSDDGRVRGWSATGSVVLDVLDEEGAVVALAFDPTGERLVEAGTADPDSPGSARATSVARTVMEREASTGRPLRVLDALPAVRAMAWSPDGRLLVIASAIGQLVTWDEGAATVVRRLACEPDPAAVSIEDGGRVTAAWPTGAVRSWDASGAQEQALDTAGEAGPSAAPAPATPVALGPGATVLVGGALLSVGPIGGVPRSLEGLAGPVTAAAWTPDGARVLGGSADGAVAVWDAATLDLLLTLQTGSPVRALSMSPDGSTMACVTTDGVRLFRSR